MAQDQKPELPYNAKLVVRQPEVGLGSPSFVPSPQVRGMKSLADGTVYWVSSDNRQLLAYQGNRLAWKTDVVAACSTIIGQPKIRKVVLSSKTIFVTVGDRTFAEVNADTGKVSKSDVQRD
ncbi:hypothetical protein ACFQT0_23275 [Hymenobacter humi]|uniref:Uncharacterized protein n=1 Tax=Hymenobacter humi TaxID=1411620 RepID=A0ABW2U8W6_9BACT